MPCRKETLPHRNRLVNWSALNGIGQAMSRPARQLLDYIARSGRERFATSYVKQRTHLSRSSQYRALAELRAAGVVEHRRRYRFTARGPRRIAGVVRLSPAIRVLALNGIRKSQYGTTKTQGRGIQEKAQGWRGPGLCRAPPKGMTAATCRNERDRQLAAARAVGLL